MQGLPNPVLVEIVGDNASQDAGIVDANDAELNIFEPDVSFVYPRLKGHW